MGLTDYIKTILLNNRVEQYNTKRSYWGGNEKQPRTDGINTGLDLHDALSPVINITIANARYAVKLDGYTLGIENRIDKTNEYGFSRQGKQTISRAGTHINPLGKKN